MKLAEIIFENNDFVALNKPSGLLSVPDRTQSAESLKDILLKKYGQIYTVHRLDRGTSGVIVFAKSESFHQYLSVVFEERSVEKYYQGFVQGTMQEKKGSVNEPIAEHPAKNGRMVIFKKGKPSLTDYEVAEEFGLYSFLGFRIHTGRTHQIRVHLKHIGHPILCDELYGHEDPIYLSSFKRNFKHSKAEEEQERPLLSRLALHSQRLIFKDKSNQLHDLQAPLPKDFKALLQQLRKWGPKLNAKGGG